MKLLHFAFIGAFSGQQPHQRLNGAQIHTPISKLCGDALKVNVGGVKYSLFHDDIRKHPGSFFDKLLSKSNEGKAVSIDRDGALFKFVNAFLVNGQLPVHGAERADFNNDVILALKDEASFFNLAGLEAECDNLWKCSLANKFTAPKDLLTIHKSILSSANCNVIRQVWRPFTVKCSFPRRWTLERRLVKNSSGDRVDVEELISLAKEIASSDANREANSGAFEIKARLLCENVLTWIGEEMNPARLFPDIAADIRPIKLVIRTADGVKDPNIGISDEHNCLGFVEVPLNSAYTGGELQVTHDGQTTNVTAKFTEWVAVPADVNCTISPVTSGARVSLVYGIYGINATTAPTLTSGRTKYVSTWNSLLEFYEGDKEYDYNYCDEDEMEKLIYIAKYLRPEQDTSTATTFEIGTFFFLIDPGYLQEIITDAPKMQEHVRAMFPHKEITFRPNKIQLRTANQTAVSQDDAEVEVEKNTDDKKDGYLGTLVMVNRDDYDALYTGGAVTVTAADGSKNTIDSAHNWYAVAAGSQSMVGSITSGIRLSIHYDIYDVTPEHDPLSNFAVANSTETVEPPPVTRTTASERVRREVLAAVDAELATSDAVVITLQHVYPVHQDLSRLKGGDQALYQILSNTDASRYDVQSVNVTLHSALDSESGRNKIGSGTYYTENADGATSTTRLIVPISLNMEHQNAENKDTNTVTGLRVTKKKE